MIAWIVATTVAAVAAIICAIYFFAESNRITQESDNLAKKYHDVVAEAALTGTDVSDLKSKRDDTAGGFNPRMTVLDIAIKQRDDLSSKLAGPGSTPDKAMSASARILQSAADKAKELNIPPPAGDNLAAAADSLTKAVTALQAQVDSLTKERDAARTQAQNAAAQVKASSDTFAKGLADANGQKDQALAGATQDRSSKDEQIKKLTTDAEAAQKAAQDAQTQSQAAYADVSKKLDEANKRVLQLQEKLGGTRINTADAVVRQADGKIIRVPGNGTVYINLGNGDQIAPGLTFEVYDRIEGVPSIGDPSTEENLPKGKAAIEVIRVGPGSSECRIIRSQPGQNIVEGDLVENLVYDRNTKYNFVVYGNFDLDQNGVATPGDAEVVKGLITRWGGKTTDKVNADTDFVVLGKEPVIPNFSKEEAQEPINAAKLAQATADAEAYDNVKRQAVEFHIPILNQNRFLYFIGYYEMAQR